MRDIANLRLGVKYLMSTLSSWLERRGPIVQAHCITSWCGGSSGVHYSKTILTGNLLCCGFSSAAVSKLRTRGRKIALEKGVLFVPLLCRGLGALKKRDDYQNRAINTNLATMIDYHERIIEEENKVLGTDSKLKKDLNHFIFGVENDIWQKWPYIHEYIEE